MARNNALHVFICEDPDIAQQIVKQHYCPGKITYAGLFDPDDRGEIIGKLGAIQ